MTACPEIMVSMGLAGQPSGPLSQAITPLRQREMVLPVPTAVVVVAVVVAAVRTAPHHFFQMAPEAVVAVVVLVDVAELPEEEELEEAAHSESLPQVRSSL